MLKNIVLMILSISIMSCSGGKMEEQKMDYKKISDVPASTWEKLSQKKIFFGHQSVGFNILDGINDIKKELPIKMDIIETNNIKDIEKGGLAHYKVGSNTKPLTKIKEFSDFINNGIGDNADIALLKLCYIDFNNNTKVENVFNEYKKSINGLKKKYPKTTFLHTTVPLVTLQRGVKAWIKKIIGRPVAGEKTNMVRNEFNDMLKKEFIKNAPIFDIAELESTYPDGKREIFIVDGKKYYAMAPIYTDDGGHLNMAGRKYVAEQFILEIINN